jgi:hypothetical protein
METKHVTQADKDKYRGFFRYHLDGIIRRRLTDKSFAQRIYHYTSGETLVRILESGELWATQSSCLNDEQESLFAVEMFRKKVEARRREPLSQAFASCLGTFEELMRDPGVERSSAFVSCFSAKRDDLSQWRA